MPWENRKLWFWAWESRLFRKSSVLLHLRASPLSCFWYLNRSIMKCQSLFKGLCQASCQEETYSMNARKTLPSSFRYHRFYCVLSYEILRFSCDLSFRKDCLPWLRQVVVYKFWKWILKRSGLTTRPWGHCRPDRLHIVGCEPTHPYESPCVVHGVVMGLRGPRTFFSLLIIFSSRAGGGK